MTTKQEKILQEARLLIGPIEYQYEMRDDQVLISNDKSILSRLNCARLIQYLYKSFGVAVGPSSRDQAIHDGKEILLPYRYITDSGIIQKIEKRLEVGDLIFFRGKKGRYNDDDFQDEPVPIYIGHVGIYSGNGNIIHCFRDKNEGPGEIKEESLTKVAVTKKGIVMVKRVLEDAE